METEQYLSKLTGGIKVSVALRTYISMVILDRQFKKNTVMECSALEVRKLEMIKSGSIRIYALNGLMATEHTLDLLFEEDFLSGALIYSPQSAPLYMHFLEDTVLLGIAEEDMQLLLRIFPESVIFIKHPHLLALEKLYQHIYVLSALKAAERYKWYETYNRKIIYRSSLKHLSAFLGMDIKTLGRIRSKRDNK